MKQKGTTNVTYTMRLQLEALLKAGLNKKQIAAQLGVCLATVYNELKRGEYTYKRYSYTDYWGERHYKPATGYSPNIAEDKYRLNMSAHGAPLKLGNDYDFVRYVEKRVCADKVSPSAVCGEIKRNRPCKTVVSKSITVDNGSEFADFAGLETSVYGGKRTAVYYCHPYTSCERGTNERINRDIRRLFPKGTDFSTVSDKRVQAAAQWVNAYPREIFGFGTSAEAFATAVASLL